MKIGASYTKSVRSTRLCHGPSTTLLLYVCLDSTSCSTLRGATHEFKHLFIGVFLTGTYCLPIWQCFVQFLYVFYEQDHICSLCSWQTVRHTSRMCSWISSSTPLSLHLYIGISLSYIPLKLFLVSNILVLALNRVLAWYLISLVKYACPSSTPPL